MGYAVNCSGAELFKRLDQGAESMLGRRYGFYVIMLATKVDDVALRWITQYGHDIHETTGDDAAFIVFGNVYRFKAEYPMAADDESNVIDEEATDRIFRPGSKQLYRTTRKARTPDIPTIAVSRHAIRRGAAGISPSLMSQTFLPNGRLIQKQVFVESMTQESNRLAQALGVGTDELPCLIFVEDPSLDTYVVVPLRGDEAALHASLRSIMGEFRRSSTYVPYMQLISDLNSLFAERRQAAASYQSLVIQLERQRRERPKPPALIDLLPAKEYPELEGELMRWCANYFGNPLPEPVRDQLVKPMLKSVLHCKRLQKTIEDIGDLIPLLQRESWSDSDHDRINRFYRDRLRYLMPPGSVMRRSRKDLSPQEWREIVRLSLDESNPNLERALATLAQYQKTIDELDPSKSAGARSLALEASVERVRRNIEGLDRAITAKEALIRGYSGRPSIERIVERILTSERRRVQPRGPFRMDTVSTVIGALQLALSLATTRFHG